MQRSLVTVLIAMLSLLSACASSPGASSPPEPSEGVILGSITYDSSMGEYSLLIASAGGAKAPKVSVGYPMFPPLGPMYDDALKSRGGTFAIRLAAGEYRIVGWQVRQGPKISRSLRPMDVGFVVEPGRASYLGNLHFDENWEVSLRDRAERDLPVLKARHAYLGAVPMAVTVAAGLDFKWPSGEYDLTMQLPRFVYMPVKR